MAVSKLAVAAVAAIFAGGAAAGVGADPFAAAPTQVRDERPVTPIAAIARPLESFEGLPVRLTDGRTVGRVLAIRTDASGHAAGIKIALADGPALWLDRRDLVYSRSQDAIIAHDVHAPSLTVAAR